MKDGTQNGNSHYYGRGETCNNNAGLSDTSAELQLNGQSNIDRELGSICSGITET